MGVKDTFIDDHDQVGSEDFAVHYNKAAGPSPTVNQGLFHCNSCTL